MFYKCQPRIFKTALGFGKTVSSCSSRANGPRRSARPGTMSLDPPPMHPPPGFPPFSDGYENPPEPNYDERLFSGYVYTQDPSRPAVSDDQSLRYVPLLWYQQQAENARLQVDYSRQIPMRMPTCPSTPYPVNLPYQYPVNMPDVSYEVRPSDQTMFTSDYYYGEWYQKNTFGDAYMTAIRANCSTSNDLYCTLVQERNNQLTAGLEWAPVLSGAPEYYTLTAGSGELIGYVQNGDVPCPVVTVQGGPTPYIVVCVNDFPEAGASELADPFAQQNCTNQKQEKALEVKAEEFVTSLECSKMVEKIEFNKYERMVYTKAFVLPKKRYFLPESCNLMNHDIIMDSSLRRLVWLDKED